ncbi:MAG TPA: Asp-tRNA(Asn)/Glu-tRNA(Gln) amidotransferase subunit GatB [Acidimicrobiia bacterium]|nr:Asp-tRNA(Asn)/Glu-tRNA(Gln) amidotransferase subunit GatB [Acidimicrobiia bacterium]
MSWAPPSGWEPVIGIEVHVELRTESKMFCGCRVAFGQEPNVDICPTCLGLPGAMPVPNRQAIEWIALIGLALNCTVSEQSVFHRKNYFYADLPKNYQISQFDIPVCHDGWLDVDVDGDSVRVGIERAHQEEDTGKSIHVGDGGRIHSATETLLDFNRSGVPLVEIVSKPDIRSPAQAKAYAQQLRAVVAELGVSDARLEEGSIRFDANVSIRPNGTTEYGTKVEVKNMNSFRSLERAVAFEIRRQADELSAGGRIVQETRHWEEEAGVTHGMRTKEGSSDYRYFTEPDLTPIVIDRAWRDRIAATLPELPATRRQRYVDAGVDPQVATVLADAEVSMRALYDGAVAAGAQPRVAANWVTGEVTGWMRREEAVQLPMTGAQLAELAAMVSEGIVSASAAKDVLDGVMRGEGDPRQVAETRDLIQIRDTDAIEAAVAEVLEANPDAVERYRGGEQKVVGFLVGQVMRATQGKADPKAVNDLLRQRLG